MIIIIITLVCYDIRETNLNVIHINIEDLKRNNNSFVVYLKTLNKSFDTIVMSESDICVNNFNIKGSRIVYNSSNNKCDGCVI